MTGPKDGDYRIVSIQLNKEIGADWGPVKPVVTSADEEIWRVAKLPDGNYTLTLEGTRRHSRRQDLKVVVSDTQPGDPWTIHGDREGGPYWIAVPGLIRPPLSWALFSQEPKSEVTLAREEFPQLWKFVPV